MKFKCNKCGSIFDSDDLQIIKIDGEKWAVCPDCFDEDCDYDEVRRCLVSGDHITQNESYGSWWDSLIVSKQYFNEFCSEYPDLVLKFITDDNAHDDLVEFILKERQK